MLYHQINNQSSSSSNNNNNNKKNKSNDKSLNKNTSTTVKTNVKSGRQQPTNVKSQHFTQFKFQMIFIILFCGLFTCCIKYANTQETNYFYADGKQFSLIISLFLFWNFKSNSANKTKVKKKRRSLKTKVVRSILKRESFPPFVSWAFFDRFWPFLGP